MIYRHRNLGDIFMNPLFKVTKFRLVSLTSIVQRSKIRTRLSAEIIEEKQIEFLFYAFL